MFRVDDLSITMYEGDFGEILPITITKGNIQIGDIFKFFIKNGSFNNIIDKTIPCDINNKELTFSLTQEESNLLQKGIYIWGIKQYRNTILIDTLTANNLFEVVRG